MSILKKDGTLQARYSHVFCDLLRFSNRKSEKFYYNSWTRSKGKYALVDSDHTRMLEVLNFLGIKYNLGNDGVRGGREHDFIEVIYDGRNKAVKKLREIEISKSALLYEKVCDLPFWKEFAEQ